MFQVRYITYICCMVCFAFGSGSHILAQDEQGLIYGKVFLKGGTELEGVIRWGFEELFWDHIFEAKKETFESFQYLSEKEILQLVDQEERKSLNWNFMELWQNRYPKKSLVFRCRFGDFAFIRPLSEDKIEVGMKDGRTFNLVSGYSNDIGKRIFVYGEENTPTRVAWKSIQRIEFLPTPAQPFFIPVYPIYASIKTTSGKYEGYLRWDREECLSTHILNGQNAYGKLEIAFEDIKEIKAYNDGSRVKINTGQVLELNKHQDVDANNTGICIRDPELGTRIFSWKDFVSMEILENVVPMNPRYEEFPSPQYLQGKIHTRSGKVFKGRIIFDLDEAMDYETLEGLYQGITHIVPFRNIKIVQRIDNVSASIQLRSGKKLVLEKMDDVSDNNWGILVWESEAGPTYLPWKDVHHVVFEQNQ